MPRLRRGANHVDMIGFYASLAGHFGDGHFAFLGKQFREMAVVFRIEVLNQHECHAGIVGQMAEQLRECLQPAGRGAYPNNGGASAFRAFFPGWWLLPPRRRRERNRLLTVFFATRHHYLSLKRKN